MILTGGLGNGYMLMDIMQDTYLSSLPSDADFVLC